MGARGARHAACNPRLDNPPHTGAGAPLMTTWLERAVQRASPSMRAGFRQRANLGVRLARALVIALPHDHAGRRHHDRADERIGTGASAAPRGMKERAVHELLIGIHHFSSNRPFTYSSAEKGTRSSIPSP